MRKYLRPLLAGLYAVTLLITPAIAENAASTDAVPALTGVRADGDGVVLELSQLMPYNVFTLSNPWRVVVEVPGVLYKADSKLDVNGAIIKRIRGYQFKENPLITRVVVDVTGPVDYKTSAEGNQVTVALKDNKVAEPSGEAADAPTRAAAPAHKSVSKSAHQDLLASLPREEVTLDFEGADVRDVIRLMAETSNINIIYGPEVNGQISVHLKKVPFDEAFTTILNLKGLVASQLGANILRVTTPDLLQKERAKAVLVTKTINVNYLKADEMAQHIQAVMNSQGRHGTITVAPETNSLVITDTDEGIADAQRLVAQLDKQPKQVMIEARIVEINLNNGLDIGVQWEFVGVNQRKNGQTRNFIGTNAGANARTFDAGRTTGVRDTDGNFGPAGPDANGTGVSLPGPTQAGITFGFVDSKNFLSASLAALISESKAKILSAPKVVTINGEAARIEAVQDIRFRTSTVSNGVVTSDFKTVSAGIILEVTPTINAEDRITLRIKPESSFPTQESTDAGPIIRTRTAQTTVVIKDGDTLVIGGLIDDQDTKGVSKVPILGDIPILGAFFRSNTNRKIRNELLVFVTPRIVRD